MSVTTIIVRLNASSDDVETYIQATSGASPRKTLEKAIAALQSELDGLDGCPFHKAQTLASETVELSIAAERVAQHWWDDINITGTRDESKFLVWGNLLRNARKLLLGEAYR